MQDSLLKEKKVLSVTPQGETIADVLIVVCSWIAGELCRMGLPDKAKVLAELWDNFSISAVGNVIQASFGHPHRDYIGLNRH